MRDPLGDMAEEILSALGKAIGTETHADTTNPRDPRLFYRDVPVDTEPIRRLYTRPGCRPFIDRFIALSGNPEQTRARLGLPQKARRLGGDARTVRPPRLRMLHKRR
jgi:hypothetical protein